MENKLTILRLHDLPQTLVAVKCPMVYQIEFKSTIILLKKISSINNTSVEFSENMSLN